MAAWSQLSNLLHDRVFWGCEKLKSAISNMTSTHKISEKLWKGGELVHI